MLEFIQGPNKVNQNILILNDFVTNVAVDILAMKYHDDVNNIEEGSTFERLDSRLESITIRKSKSEFPSLSIGKSTYRKIGERKVTLPSTNYMISLAKLRVLSLLNHLLDGFEPTDYVFYMYRREINPEIFRLILAYQHYFFYREYNYEYKTDLFFNYFQNINIKDRSPFIIEIGFECYFLLKKMEENLSIDYDERYNKQ